MVCSSAQSLDRAHKNGPKYVQSMAHSGDDTASVWCYVRSLVGRSRGGGLLHDLRAGISAHLPAHDLRAGALALSPPSRPAPVPTVRSVNRGKGRAGLTLA